MKFGVIYVLKDPITEEIRYIGKTITKPERRYTCHMYQWKRSPGRLTHVNSWIKGLQKVGLKPIMEVVSSNIPEDELAIREINYIKAFRLFGTNLCNHTDGGEGTIGYIPTKETKAKVAKTRKTSIAWKQKCIDHSGKLKLVHQTGLVKFGYAHLAKEKRVAIGKNHAKTMIRLRKLDPKRFIKFHNRKRCAQIDASGNIIMEFPSCTAAGIHFKIENTHVVRVCKKKSPHTHGLLFKYLDPIIQK